MEIYIHKWNRDDLPELRREWLAYYDNATRPDMTIRRDADAVMRQWLDSRFQEPSSFGFVAETHGAIAGFLIGRISDWESVPPIIKTRRIGIIDALHVGERFRRSGIGSLLIERALERMRAANAVAVETIYDASDEPSARTWHRAGFASWMVHAYRIL